MLNDDPDSPFHGLIKRASADTEARKRAVVSDTVLVTSIEESLNQTSGVLFSPQEHRRGNDRHRCRSSNAHHLLDGRARRLPRSVGAAAN